MTTVDEIRAIVEQAESDWWCPACNAFVHATYSERCVTCNSCLGERATAHAKTLLAALDVERSQRAVVANLVRRFVKYIREDDAVTPGATRLARVTDEAAVILSDDDSPAPPVITVREAARRGLPLRGRDAQALEDVLADTERERDAFRTEVERLTKALADANDARARSCADIADLRATHASTKRVMEARITELHGERDSARAEVERLTKDLRNLSRNYASQEEYAADWRSRATTAESQLAALREAAGRAIDRLSAAIGKDGK